MSKRTPEPVMPDPPDRGRISRLVRNLSSDIALLFRQEIALARAEISQNIRDFFASVSKVAVGGGVAFVGLLVFIAFLIIGLGMLLGGEYWLSALIVAVLLLGGGGGLAFLGAKRIGTQSVAPEGTIETVRTTQAWAAGEVAELTAALRHGGEAGSAPRIRIEPPSRGAGAHTADSAMTAGAVSARGAGALAGEDSLGASAGREDAARGSRAAAERSGGASGGDPNAGNRLPLSVPLHKRVLREITEDDVLGRAAQVAYFMFTSLPPALLVLFALSGIFGGAALGEFIAVQLQSTLPGSADDPNSAAGFISSFVNQVVQETAPGPLSIGLVLGLWAASAVFVALTEALNRAYDVVENRSWIKRRALAVGVAIAFMVLFLLGSAVLIAGPHVANAIDLAGALDVAWSIAQWPLAFLLVVTAFFIVYYLLPNRDQRACKGVLFKSSAVAAALWLVATIGFRIYISNFGSYGETYGFVGAILVLLLWMYITGIVILVGGEIGSEMEREA